MDMDDPLLSSLCTICHIDEPKYTCPRCSMQTCSLKCSKRHKLWSECNGVRDPTVYMPIDKLATPAGVDHDYNFIHGIEIQKQRQEKLLVEDLEIVQAAELDRARNGETRHAYMERMAKERESHASAAIERICKAYRINVITAPKGMRRSKENTTHYSRHHKTIQWQVEWMREREGEGEGEERMLCRAFAKHPIGDSYDNLCDEERRMNMTDEEKRSLKKRRAGKGLGHHAKSRLAKRFKTSEEGQWRPTDMTTAPTLQNPLTSTWGDTPPEPIVDDDEEAEQVEPEAPTFTLDPQTRDYHLYLHRPLTPASFPKVLVPLDAEKGLTEQLFCRDVLEFPTIYVLKQKPEDLPSKYMLEKAYLAAIGQGAEDSHSDSSGSPDTSSEDSSSSMEEGEVV